jgi:hypothetical protein
MGSSTDGVFVFTRPDGRRIAECGRCFSGNIGSGAELFGLNASEGLAIDAATSRSRWQGEALDYDMAIEAMRWPRAVVGTGSRQAPAAEQ